MYYSAADLSAALPYALLIEALGRDLKRDRDIASPLRISHDVSERADKLLTMPSWEEGKLIGIKLVTIFSGNSAIGKPGVQGVYAVFDGQDGAPKAIFDGTELTLRRTAALGALASKYLSDANAVRMLVMGTGALALHLARAHAAIRRWDSISIWGRSFDKANALAETLRAEGLPASAVESAEAAAREAGVIACATSTVEPILRSDWVSPGTHVNLMGSYAPHMQEAEAALIARAKGFVDNRSAVLSEAGDIMVPIRDGLIDESWIRADISDLARGARPELGPDDITVFKSVGWGALDLIAGRAAMNNMDKG